MNELGVDKFTFEFIGSAEYIDVETLLIRESVCMNEYSSIESGYNTIHSVDLQNYIKYNHKYIISNFMEYNK
jgi:hypothetical protein